MVMFFRCGVSNYFEQTLATLTAMLTFLIYLQKVNYLSKSPKDPISISWFLFLFWSLGPVSSYAICFSKILEIMDRKNVGNTDNIFFY